MGSVEMWSQSEFGVRLHDGRILGCAQHGDPSGPPLLWFPGTPGSRLAVIPQAARQGPFRMVVVERPGFGRSTARPGRTIVEFPADVRELLDVLGIARAALVGASGAGPYLAACARFLPERLTKVVMVSCPAPISGRSVRRHLSLRRQIIFAVARFAPGLLRRTMEAQRFAARPEAAYRVATADAAPVDCAIVERTLESQVAMTREALRQGVEALAWELHLVTRPWGFRLEEIEAEVHVFHGLEDRLTPPAMGEHLARTIPGARGHFIQGAGHFLHADHWDRIAAVLA